MPKSNVGAVPRVFGNGRLPHTNPPKQSKNPFYYSESSDKLIFIDKKELGQ
jgi:hypothetical protein